MNSATRVLSGAMVALGLAVAGCRVQEDLAAAPTSPTTPAAPGTPPATAACQMGASTPPGSIADPNGPFFHTVVIARTDNGVTLRDAREVIAHASVPDGARLGSTLFVYYVNGAEGGVWVARVEGSTATPISPISINGVVRPQGVVDPDVTPLPGGRLRMAFLHGGPPGSTTPRAMCLADSTDGVNFSVVSTAVQFPAGDTTTDPSLAQMRDGTWLMAMSRGQTTLLARSSDGVTFMVGETLAYGGVPELAALPDGRVRLYVCARGIESYTSSDQGSSWAREGSVVAPEPGGPRIICDPSAVAGTDLFVYKTAP